MKRLKQWLSRVASRSWLAAMALLALSPAYAADNTVTVKAAAIKGYVFAGWYTNSARTVKYTASDGVDYRTETRTYSYPEVDALFAKFVTKEDDAASINVVCEPASYYAANNDMTLICDVQSASLPTVTAANLPTGVKFDAKTFTFSGKPTKPGETKDVTITVKNKSETKGKTFTRTIKIGDATSSLLPKLKYNDANAYPAFNPGKAVNMAEVLGADTMSALSQGGWTVSGLPAGITFDAKTGTFKGTPTAPNATYLVTFKKGNEMATITLRTSAFPTITVTTYVDGVESDDPAFKVTGAGAYAWGKTATLSATCPKGYVFIGWSGDSIISSLEQDYRTSSGFKFTMPESADPEFGINLQANFISVKNDFIVYNSGIDEAHFSVGEDIAPISLKDNFYSFSLPSFTVSGLPAGLKYDAKAMTISGKPTKTGVNYVTITAKNASGYSTGRICKFFVGNATENLPDANGADLDEEILDALDGRMTGDRVTDDPWEVDETTIPGTLHIPDMNGAKATKVAVTGLPAGLVWEFDEEESALLIWGVYTKEGRYTTKITVTYSDKKTATTTKTLTVQHGGSAYVEVATSPGSEGMGTVTGSGIYKFGTALKLAATPKSGNVFAGWYSSGEEMDTWNGKAEVDYRTKNCNGFLDAYFGSQGVPILVSGEFVSVEEDKANLELVHAYDDDDFGNDDPLEGYEWRVNTSIYYESDDIWVESISLPGKITFTGIPAGLTLDADDDGSYCIVYDPEGKTSPAPGRYTVTAKASNESKATKTVAFTIVVPNLRNESSLANLDYENGYTLVQGEKLTIEGVDLRGWTVTGLPAGITFDSKTGTFKGAPTQAGKSYTVYFKKSGEATATVNISVEANPAWFSGTFNGDFVSDFGPDEEDYDTDSLCTATISASGALSATIKTVGRSNASLSASGFDEKLTQYGSTPIYVYRNVPVKQGESIGIYGTMDIFVFAVDFDGMGARAGRIAGVPSEDSQAFVNDYFGSTDYEATVNSDPGVICDKYNMFYALQNVWKSTAVTPPVLVSSSISKTFNLSNYGWQLLQQQNEDWFWVYGDLLWGSDRPEVTITLSSTGTAKIMALGEDDVFVANNVPVNIWGYENGKYLVEVVPVLDGDMWWMQFVLEVGKDGKIHPDGIKLASQEAGVVVIGD